MDLNNILNLLITYHLTADELLFIYLTTLAQDDERHPEYLKKWFDNGGKDQVESLFTSLKEKKIINKDYNPNVYGPDDIEFNKNFIKSWMKNSRILGKELFDNYPPFLLINGSYCPIRNISKKFSTLDEFYFYYASTIGNSIEKHKEIMELLDWGKKNNLINFGILEFVASNKWIELKMLKDNNVGNVVVNNDSLYVDD